MQTIDPADVARSVGLVQGHDGLWRRPEAAAFEEEHGKVYCHIDAHPKQCSFRWRCKEKPSYCPGCGRYLVERQVKEHGGQ